MKRRNKPSTEFSFLNFMFVAMAGWKVSLGATLMLVFLFEKNCIRPKKCPWDLIIFLYYFSLQRHLLFYYVALLKKNLADVFFSNSKGSVTSKMRHSDFRVFDKRGWVLWIISRWNKCLWSREGIWKLGYWPFRCLILFLVVVVFSSILMASNTSCMHFSYPKESSFSLFLIEAVFTDLKDRDEDGH